MAFENFVVDETADTEMNIKEMRLKGLDKINLSRLGTCEHSNQQSGYGKCWGFLDHLLVSQKGLTSMESADV